MRRCKNTFAIFTWVTWCLGGSITYFLFFSAPALAQLSPGDLTPSTQSSAPTQVQILTPTLHKEQNEVAIPAAFWNEHLADWVEVAITGRPSDFLHETIAAVTTTKTKMEESLRTVGFHDADAWVNSIADFPRVRGDRALVLLTVTLGNKTETFSLDELLTFEGWNTSVGPYGWMFKGSPGSPSALSTLPAPSSFAPNQQVLRDDPQIALEFKGLQHLSQSYMDHPLCYDNWIYPDFHYHRNIRMVPKTFDVPALSEASQKTLAGGLAEFLNDPKIPAAEIQRRLNPAAADNLAFKVTRDGKTLNIDFKTIARNAQLHDFWMGIYDSNGSIPLQLTIRRVTETELLKQSAELWHDPAAAKFILDQLPIAAQIDKDKAALWERLAAAKSSPPATQASDPQSIVLMASIEKGYAALDAAWSTWACDHAQLDSQDPHDIEEFTSSKKLWQEHMNQKRDRAAELLVAEQTHFQLRELALQPESPDHSAALRQVRGKEITARNHALVLENAQPLDFWAQQKARLAADDPRQDWRRHITTQLDRAQALTTLAKAGMDFGNALQAADQSATTPAQHNFEVAALRGAIATLQAQLAEVDFEISKRQDFPDDRDLPGFIKRRDALRAEMQASQSSLNKLSTQP